MHYVELHLLGINIVDWILISGKNLDVYLKGTSNRTGTYVAPKGHLFLPDRLRLCCYFAC